MLLNSKKEYNLLGVSPQTWARTIVMIIALVEMWWVEFTTNPFPEVLSEITIEDLTPKIERLIYTIGWIWGWWKNNSFSVSAQHGDELMHAEEGAVEELEYTQKVHQPDTDHYVGVG